MRTPTLLCRRLAVLTVVALVAPSCGDVRVTTVEVASVDLEPDDASLKVDDTVRLEATLRDESGNVLPERPLSWASQDPGIATVEDGGLVKAVAPGTTSIRASSGGATGEASITVIEPPEIALSRSELTFDAVAGSTSAQSSDVSVTNSGEAPLEGLDAAVSYPSGGPTGWLAAQLGSSSAPTAVTVRADPSDLSPGTYRGEVAITAPDAVNSPRTIEVTFHIGEPPPLVAVSPTSVSFSMVSGGPTPSPETVSVTNAGGGELTGLAASVSYASGQPSGWLSAALAGSVAPTELVLSVDPGGIAAPAVLDAAVEVSGTGASGTATIAVRLHLGDADPLIGLEPDQLEWEFLEGDPLPPVQEVQIRNEGGGTLAGLSASVGYEGGGPTGWLEVELTSSEAPSTLRAGLTTTDLPPGEHRATIQVASTNADNSPQPVSVTVQVSAQPSGAFSTIEADPTTIPADGAASSLLTVQLRDARGDPITSGGDAVTLATTAGSLSETADEGDGTYTATLTASTAPDTATVTGTVNGETIADEAVVAFVPGTPSGATSTIDASPTSIQADGESTSTITVRLRDAEGNELTAGGADVALSTSAGTLGAVEDGGDGTYSAILTSSTTPEEATVTGTVNGEEIEDQATVAFVGPSGS